MSPFWAGFEQDINRQKRWTVGDYAGQILTLNERYAVKIKTIGRTVSFGNYENMSMTAELEDGDDVSTSVDKLNSLLQTEILKRDSSVQLVYDVARLESDRSRLAIDISELSRRKQKAIEWCKKHGLDVDRFEDLPF